MDTLEKSLEGLNLLREGGFESEMNDPIIVIDKTHIPGFVRQKVSLWIHNTSDSTLYFKIVEQIPNWILDATPDIPADGKLGALGAGAKKHFVGIINKNLPAGESEDVGSFIVECYPDDTYTGLIESHLHPTTIYIEDLENWSNVQKSDFDDGTAQGWTLSTGVTIVGGGVEGGGYNVRHEYSAPVGSGLWDASMYILKAVALPNTSKVRLSFYWGIYSTNGHESQYSEVKNLEVYLDNEKVFSCFKSGYAIVHTPGAFIGWFKCGLDLSDFKGQTKDIKIQCDPHGYHVGYMHAYTLIDDIVVAGK